MENSIKYCLLPLIFYTCAVLTVTADSGITLDSVDEDGSFHLYHFSEHGKITDMPAEAIENLNFKETSQIVTADGRTIIYSSFFENEFTLNRIDVDGGKTRILVNPEDDFITLRDLSPNEKTVLFTRSNYQEKRHSIGIIDIDGKGYQELVELPPDANYFNTVRFMDSKTIMYVMRRGKTNEVHLFGLDKMTNEKVIDLPGYFQDISMDGKLLFCVGDPQKKDGYIDLSAKNIVYFDHAAGKNHSYHWLPNNSSAIFLTVSKASTDVRIVDTTTGQVVLLTRLPYAEYSSCSGIFDNGSKALISIYDNRGGDQTGTGRIYTVDLNTKEVLDFSKNNGVYYVFGKACPVIYVLNAHVYTAVGEILTACVGKRREKTESIIVPASATEDGRLSIKIGETLPETTFLNRVRAAVGDEIFSPIKKLPELTNKDDSYLMLQKDESVELQFDFGSKLQSDIRIEYTGYYVPHY